MALDLFRHSDHVGVLFRSQSNSWCSQWVSVVILLLALVQASPMILQALCNSRKKKSRGVLHRAGRTSVAQFDVM